MSSILLMGIGTATQGSGPPSGSFLLLEDGSYLLLETGDKIILES